MGRMNDECQVRKKDFCPRSAAYLGEESTVELFPNSLIRIIPSEYSLKKGETST